jgi:hypothetical protein
MPPFRARILLAAGSLSLLAGLAVAETSGATSTPDTAVETSVATSLEMVTDTGVATSAETGVVEILPPGESWGGATRGEWTARAYQWGLSLPADVSPMFDPTGERCGYGQSGPVFFWVGGDQASEVACVVAEGTAIYVNVVGTECSTIEPPPYFGRTEDELRACASALVDEHVTEAQARVNGEDVDLDGYRTTSPMFTITYPENNIFGVEPGVAQAVSDSYSFIIAPPPPGEYEIVTSAIYFGERVTRMVTLIVEAPEVIESPPTT